MDYPFYYPWYNYCYTHPCVYPCYCPDSGPNGPMGPGSEPVPYAVSFDDKWHVLEGDKLETFRAQEQAIRDETTNDPIRQSQRLASFYKNEHAYWMSFQAQADAMRRGGLDDADISLQIGNEMRSLGWHNQAIAVFQNAEDNLGVSTRPFVFGQLLQSKARSLDALSRFDEANAAFKHAASVQMLSGRLLGNTGQNMNMPEQQG